MSKDLKYILVIAIVLFISIVREGCNTRNSNLLLDSVQNYSDSAQFYKTENGTHIAYNQSLLLENKEQLQSLFAKNDTMRELLDKYKNIKNVTIIKETIVIRDSIPYGIDIPCDFNPFTVKRDSIHYNFTGTIGKSFFRIDSLMIPNTQSIIVGEKKLGFLKGKEHRVEIVNSNPLIMTSNVGSYVVEEKKKWYETRAFSFLIGFGFGYGTSEYLNKK